MSKLNCWGLIVKALLIVANGVLLVLGLITIGIGSFYLLGNVHLDYVTGDSDFNGAVVIVAVGVALTFIAILGIVASSTEVLGLVVLFNLCMCGLIGLGVCTTTYIVEYDGDMSQRAQDQFYTGMTNYKLSGDSGYDATTNFYVDLIQEGYHCCGLNSPGDWLVNNPEYCVDNLGLPDSCTCSSFDVDECDSVTIPLPFLDDITFSSWNEGCKDSIDALVHEQVYIAIIVSIVIMIAEVLVLSCGCCLCVHLLRHMLRERNRPSDYALLHPYGEAAVNAATVKLPQEAVGQPPYDPACYTDSGGYPTCQPA